MLVWGFAFALIAVALERFHPVFIVWSRLLMGALVMWCVWRWHAGVWTLGREWWPRLAMLSMTGNIIPFSLIAWAEQSVPSAEVGILMALMPIATLILAHWLLDHEPLTLHRLWRGGSGLRRRSATGGRGPVLPNGEWAVARAGGDVAGNAELRLQRCLCQRLPPANPVALSLGSLLVGSLVLALPALWLQLNGPGWAPTVPSVTALLVLGALGTGVATWSYFIVVTERGPLSLDHQLLDTCVAFIAGTALLSEPWGWEHLLALALILTGVWLIQARRA